MKETGVIWPRAYCKIYGLIVNVRPLLGVTLFISPLILPFHLNFLEETINLSQSTAENNNCAITNTGWLSSRDFFRGGIYCYANFFCNANFSIVFGPNFGGGKSLRGRRETASGPPVEESQPVENIENTGLKGLSYLYQSGTDNTFLKDYVTSAKGLN